MEGPAGSKPELYVVGQAISMVGGFVRGFAQAILVLRLTDDAQAFTTTTLLQFVPLLLLGRWGGLIADRVDNRKLLIATSVVALGIPVGHGVLLRISRRT